MGWISVIFVHKAIGAVTDGFHVGATRQSLFRSVGVDPDAPLDPKQMIPDTVFFSLLERIVAECRHGRSIPVRIGASMRCDDYGAFGLAFKSAPNLLGSYRRVERYGKVVTSIANFRVECRNGTLRMAVIPGEDARLGLKMTNELAVAALISLSREVSSATFLPTSVSLTRSAPAADAEQMDHFQCPMHYGSEQDALDVDLELLKRPNRLGDERTSAFFDEHLDRELQELGDPTGMVRRVLEEIGYALSEGVPTLASIAGRLGMSNRTLQRRLADAGVSYQELTAEARQRLAENLLRDTDYALAEIAFLTGFSDQSTFTRAFKRRIGQTPANFRRVS